MNVSMIVFGNHEIERERKIVSKHEWLGEREHEDKGCGYDEG